MHLVLGQARPISDGRRLSWIWLSCVEGVGAHGVALWKARSLRAFCQGRHIGNLLLATLLGLPDQVVWGLTADANSECHPTFTLAL